MLRSPFILLAVCSLSATEVFIGIIQPLEPYSSSTGGNTTCVGAFYGLLVVKQKSG